MFRKLLLLTNIVRMSETVTCRHQSLALLAPLLRLRDEEAAVVLSVLTVLVDCCEPLTHY